MKKCLFFLLFLSFSTYIFSQTIPSNTRLFQPTTTYGYFSTGFVKHLNSAPDEFFQTLTSKGGWDYYGTPTNNMYATKFISRIGIDGLSKWHAIFVGQNDNYYKLNVKPDYSTVDNLDNIIVLCNTNSSFSTFIDASGSVENFLFSNSESNYLKIIIKLDNNGNKVWSKQIFNSPYVSLATDKNGDVFIVGQGNFSTTLDNVNLGKTFLVKLDSNTGNIIYAKSYNVNSYQFIPVFDSQNNLYVFTEPSTYQDFDFQFDAISVHSNANALNSIMLKFNNSGNVIWGKNFYTNSDNLTYSWFNDVTFDGTDFVAMGNLIKSNDVTNFLGLDGLSIIPSYESTTTQGILAKIEINGNVIWQKPIATNLNHGVEFYTNIETDEDKNIYGYFLFKDKIKIDGIEHVFDANLSNNVITKFSTNGNLIYLDNVNYGNNDYKSRMIDVIGNNKFNVMGITSQNKFLNYPITNSFSPKYYVATFGNLDSKYLSPQKNYLELTNAEFTNNPENANTFNFNLVNNVNWTATTDQSWLTLSYEKLVQKIAPSNTISDNGDAKITINAETNNTGANRTANILLSGDSGVASKTIAVTQSGLLATGETKTFITTLYPNPTSNILNIETKQKISKIEIFDLSGKLLKSENGKDKKVSVSNLTKGMYLIKLYTEIGVVNSKFIKK